MATENTYTMLAIIAMNKNEDDEHINFQPFWQDHKWMCKIRHVVPKNKSSNGNETTYTSVYKMSNIYEYFRSLLNLIMADESPSQDYQFDIPGIPSILVSHSQIKNISSTILDHIFDICRNDASWPTYKKQIKISYPEHHHEVRVEKPRRNTHYIFNEDGDPIRIY
jgi:hypothetical protein